MGNTHSDDIIDDRARAVSDARARKTAKPAAGIRINGIELDNGGLAEPPANIQHVCEGPAQYEPLQGLPKQLARSADVPNPAQNTPPPGTTPPAAPDPAAAVHEENRKLRQSIAQLEDMLVNLSRERDDLLARLTRNGHGASLERGELWQSQRVAILVDVQNMYYSAKKIYNSKISFQKLLPTLLNNRRLIRALAYTVEKEGSDQEKFYDVLRRTGFEIRSRDLIIRSDGSRKGDWDMGIAIDAISLCEKVDVIVLVTGDGDFVALVNMLKSRGVRVEVASFRESTSENLMMAASEHYIIDHEMLV